jgi:hypothetical protein
MTTVSDRLRAKATPNQSASSQVRLHVVHLGIWTTAKVSFLVGVIVGILTIIGTYVIWSILNGAGAFSALEAQLKSDGLTSGKIDLASIFGAGTAMEVAVVVAVVDVIVFTLGGVIVSLFYNGAAKLLGGLLFGFSSK